MYVKLFPYMVSGFTVLHTLYMCKTIKPYRVGGISQMIDEQQKEDLKAKLNILDVVAHDGLTIVQRGNKHSTQEHDSLILYPATNSWSWFSQADQRGKTLGGDVYQWYMHNHRCTFSEAHEALAAMAGTLPPVTVTQGHRQAVSTAEAKDYRDFAVTAWNRLQSAEGETVAAYLAKRGISLDAAKRWGLGAHYYKTATENLGWAVVFPYVNTNGQTVCNMRLIDRTDDDKCRHWGQRGGLFGARLAQPSKDKYLFAVEGELNAVSIGAATDSMGVDVVSIGNKSLLDATREQLVALAKGYGGLFTWIDDEQDARKIKDAVPVANCYKSPRRNGKKVDANDMLQQGTLGNYIAILIERHTEAAPQAAPLATAEVGENLSPKGNISPTTPAFLPENCLIVSEVGDITQWVGANVSRRLWQEITHRAKVLGWTIEATEIGELMHVTRLTAGKI